MPLASGAALSASGRAKSNFLSISVVSCPGLVLVLGLFALVTPVIAEDRCVICGGGTFKGGVVYIVEDKVAHQKVEVCDDCSKNFPDCFVCGLPANTNRVGYVELEDGRAYCGRDARTAVFREEEALHIFHEARESLDRMFSRFSTFPESNIKVGMADRLNLRDMYKLAGNDYHCPNTLGYTQSETNAQRLEHHISLMTGLPGSWLYATCAHELGHAWVAENVAPNRRDALLRDAEEGFCELLAYLYSDSRHDEAEKAMILSNAYTRGQVDLFIAAYNGYGLNDVLDWMRYGLDDRLSASEPTRIHNILVPPQKGQVPRPIVPELTGPAIPIETPSAPTTLLLKAVIWDSKKPLALINDHTFGVQEEGKVRLGTTNVTVKCLAIRQNAVCIRVNGSAEEQELMLKTK